MGFLTLKTSDAQQQTRTLTVTSGGRTVSLRVTLRLFRAIDTWCASIVDAVTGESLVQNVPLISTSVSAGYANDLLWQFVYKRIGSLWVLPRVSEMDGLNPDADTLNRFAVVWGDDNG